MKRAFLIAIFLALPLAAQTTIKCGTQMYGQPLMPIPEIESVDHVLRGSLYTVSEMQQLPAPTATISSPDCVPQWVRAYRLEAPKNWNPSADDLKDPLPGPTLRAQVGDVVQLSFFNVIDANKFPGVDDGKCDETNQGKTYPGTFDKYPDCFAGSVYTNMHYHGTHTNPNTTGDNVFLQIKPFPRKNNAKREPEMNEKAIRTAFDKFFDQCTAKLLNDPHPTEWPRRWRDLPESTRKALLDPVKKNKPEWYDIDQEMISQGNWPQYFVGAYPYCFKLPKYEASNATTTAAADVRTPHTHGKGTAEVDEAAAPSRPLLMGQAPGTHWYHAHKHGSTTINVSNGMTGAFIIEGQYDKELNDAYGQGFTRKIPPIVVNQLGTAPGLSVGAFLGPGPNFSVNGRIQPRIKMPGKSVALWRIVNSASRAGMYFLPPTSLQWKQLAQDGVQFNDANYHANTNHAFTLMSGNRADLLVKAPAYNAAAGANNLYPVLVYNTVDPSDRPPARPYFPSATLLNVEVTDDGPEMQFLAHAPSFPPFLKDIKDKDVTGWKVLKFATKAGTPSPQQQTIDGKQFDGEVGAVVLLNRTEEWKVVNETYPPSTGPMISHPFHIHINPFQITELFDPNAVLSTSNLPGTVTVATPENGPTTVTGSEETDFTRDFRVGDWIWINGKADTGPPAAPPGIVLSIIDAHHLTIDTNKEVKAASPYQIALPLYTIDANGALPGQCVIDPNDPKPCTKPASTNLIWWDTFAIPSGNNFYNATTKTWTLVPGHFRMRSNFVDYAGYYVLHCHILAHEDRGMMTVVEVAPLQTPFSHH
ncbi:MAG TPA: multicopper oxidase domain-containing protein [Thermoanaerobaculia bacterium]|nr:multicopper oxidase domain-containing protein [Thermoanaerobaculia bacterium]